jgi:hypothetical protein
LPSGFIQDLENREITDADYETLLLLDSGPVNQGSIPLHVINSFPVFKLTNESMKKQLLKNGKCNVCATEVRLGEVIRKIPCSHSFHRDCIDRWLLKQRTTCPTCGLAAYSSLDVNDNESEIKEEGQYKAKVYAVQETKKGVVKPKAIEPAESELNFMEIVGSSQSLPTLAPTAKSITKDLRRLSRRLEKAIASPSIPQPCIRQDISIIISADSTPIQSFTSTPVQRRKTINKLSNPRTSKPDQDLNSLMAISGISISR